MKFGLRYWRSFQVLVFLVVGGLMALSTQAADNLLIGTWKWDNDMTLREFKLPTEGSEQLKNDAARAKGFIEAEARNLNSNVTLTYTDKDYTQVVVGGNGVVLSKISSPYRIVEIRQNYVVVDQMKNGGLSKLFFAGNSFYVEVKVGEFIYRDYFTRT